MRLLGTTLAIAALALAGCDGDDSEDRSQEPSTTKPAATAPQAQSGTLTAGEYRARVNRLCREDERAAADIGEPSAADQVEPFLRRALAYGKKRTPLYEELEPPSELRAGHQQSLELSERVEGELEDLLERIDAGGDPVREFTEAALPLGRLIDSSNRLARRMGTKDCVVEVPEPGAQQPQQTF